MSWDQSKPPSGLSLRESNPLILANWAALQTQLGTDHNFPTNGKHNKITLESVISTPANTATEGYLYIKTANAVPELHFEDGAGNEIQLSSAGDLKTTTNLVVDGTSTLTGAIAAAASLTLGAGADLKGGTSSGIAIGTAGLKFNVADDDSGDTIIAGTLDVGSTLDVTGESTLATLAATTMTGALAMGTNPITGLEAADASGEAVHFGQWKADNVAAAIFGLGSESAALPNGLIIKSGFSNGDASSGRTISFADAFPGGILSANATIRDSGATGTTHLVVTARDVNGMSVETRESCDGVEWIAIGY